MQIYKLRPDPERYMALRLVEPNLAPVWNLNRADPLADRWQPVRVQLDRSDARSKRLQRSDFPACPSGRSVFTRRAMEALWDLLAPHGEFLPLQSADGDFYVFNCLTRLEGAVDESRSELRRTVNGVLAGHGKLALHPLRILGKHAFQLAGLGASLFVTDRVAEQIEAAGLTGFQLIPVWEEPALATPVPVPWGRPKPGPAAPPPPLDRLGMAYPPLQRGVRVDEIQQILRRGTLRRHATQIEAWLQPGARIHTTPVPNGSLAVGQSKIGGLPDLPPGSAWPEQEGKPLWFLAQINLSEIADWRLPPAGLLSFFHSPGAGCRVQFTEPGQPLARAVPPDGVPLEPPLGECALQFGLVLTLPAWDSPPVQSLGLSAMQLEGYEEIERLLYESSGGFPDHQLLGHPRVVRGDMSPDLPQELGKWTLLLQLASDHATARHWGESGSLYFWIPASDLSARRFDRVVLLHQNG